MSKTADFYIGVEDDLSEELGRQPTWDEVVEEAQDRMDRMRYGAELRVESAMEDRCQSKQLH